MIGSDAALEIKVADNKMKVTANYTPPFGDGASLTVEDVISQLESMGITTGLYEEKICAMCLSDKPMRNVLIAEGIDPEQGEKARIEYFFSLDQHRKAAVKDDGSIDFRDLGEIASAKTDQELYRKIPPTIGPSGSDVYGNELAGLPGKDLKLALGPGTELDEDDSDLVRASCEGEIVLHDGTIQISQIHRVNGDVDYATGNIKFKGSVKISGTVKSGFRVEAGGDIEINGNIEDAEVIGENDITVAGGFTGSGEGLVKAGRDVTVKFVENQRIQAERDIIIKGSSYHSMLSAGRSIIAKGGKCMIVGGQSEAKSSIHAKRFGSEAGATTTIKVGINPKLSERIKKVDTEIWETKKALEKVEKSMAFLERQAIDFRGKLPAKKKALLDGLKKTKTALPEKLKALEESRDEIMKERKHIYKAFAAAEVSVYPQVKVFVGSHWMSVEQKCGPSKFMLKNDEVTRESK